MLQRGWAVDLQPLFRHADWMKKRTNLILISLIDQTQKAQVHLQNKEKGEKQSLAVEVGNSASGETLVRWG
jgi:hypothetical protein